MVRGSHVAEELVWVVWQGDGEGRTLSRREAIGTYEEEKSHKAEDGKCIHG